MKGSVKWFRDDLGYGFIEGEQGDIFVHYTAVQAEGHRTLAEGQTVLYDEVMTEKGRTAQNVLVVTEQ